MYRLIKPITSISNVIIKRLFIITSKYLTFLTYETYLDFMTLSDEGS